MPTNTMAVVCIRPGVGDMPPEALRWAPVGIGCRREKISVAHPGVSSAEKKNTPKCTQGYRVPTNTVAVVCIRPGVGGMGAEALRWAAWEPRHWAEEEI